MLKDMKLKDLKEDVGLCAQGKNKCKTCMLENYCRALFKKVGKDRQRFEEELYDFRVKDTPLSVMDRLIENYPEFFISPRQ